MRPSQRKSIVTLFIVSALLVCGIARATDNPVPVPKSTPLPATAPEDHAPFLKSTRNLTPSDVQKSGYTEDEFVISGKANVYDWPADGKLTVKTPDAPYATRILVRHPVDPARFSGTVVVELMFTSRQWDWQMMWGYLRSQIIAHGDAWVGVTMPGAVDSLPKFDSVRYAGLAFKNPAPGGCPTASPDREDGLKWDMLSQVGAALKSGAPSQPLSGFKVQYIYMTTQGGDVATYANAIQSHARLENGKPVYDGFLMKSLSAPSRINQCAAVPAKGDPRYVIHNVGVPVITVEPQRDVVGGLAARRPDSDEPADRYRLYEIAGAQHLDTHAFEVFPSLADQAAAGNVQGTVQWPFTIRCTPEIQMSDNPLLGYEFRSTLVNLDQWVRKGTSPPHAERVKIKDEDTDHPSVALDSDGNGLGGVRTFYVDVPAATINMSSPGPANCPEFGNVVPFSWAHLEALYGNYKNYVGKVEQSVDRSVKERWFTDYDAREIKRDLEAKAEQPLISSQVTK